MLRLCVYPDSLAVVKCKVKCSQKLLNDWTFAYICLISGNGSMNSRNERVEQARTDDYDSRLGGIRQTFTAMIKRLRLLRTTGSAFG